MNIQRNIQLSAVVVAANGILALGGMTPSQALASSCEYKIGCTTSFCGGGDRQFCQAIADPGCTAVSEQCYTWEFMCPDLGYTYYACEYTSA